MVIQHGHTAGPHSRAGGKGSREGDAPRLVEEVHHSDVVDRVHVVHGGSGVREGGGRRPSEDRVGARVLTERARERARLVRARVVAVPVAEARVPPLRIKVVQPRAKAADERFVAVGSLAREGRRQLDGRRCADVPIPWMVAAHHVLGEHVLSRRAQRRDCEDAHAGWRRWPEMLGHERAEAGLAASYRRIRGNPREGRQLARTNHVHE